MKRIAALIFFVSLALHSALKAQVVNPPTGNTGCSGGPCLPLAGGTQGPSITGLVLDVANYANLGAAISAANTYAATNESGSGHAVYVQLHDASYSLAPAVSAQALSQVATSSGGTAVYTGVFAGGGSNVYAGLHFYVTGFPAISFTLTAAGNASSNTTAYSGTFTNGGSNALAGQWFVVTGFDTAANNGVYQATASTTSTLTLANPNGVSDTHAAAAAFSPNNGDYICSASTTTTLTLSNESAWAQTATASAMSPQFLNSGVSLVGVMPRVEYISGTMPDLNMVPNGGSWIDCGSYTNECFAGTGSRGVNLEQIGFKDFGQIATFGGNNTDGIAFSTFRSVYGIGSTSVSTPSNGLNFINFQHVRGDHINIFDVNNGLTFTQQSNLSLYGNSDFSDVYIYTYAKSVTNGNNAIPGLTVNVLNPATGSPQSMNDLQFYGLHVNSYSGDGTGMNILIAGYNSSAQVFSSNFYGVDEEGANLYGVFSTYMAASRVSIKSIAGNTYDFGQGNYNYGDIFECTESCKTGPIVGSGSNYYYGAFNAVPNSGVPTLTWNTYGNCSLQYGGCAESNVFPLLNNIIVQSFNVQLGVNPAGCSVNGTLLLKAGSTTIATITTANGSGTFAATMSPTNVASSGGPLSVQVGTGASGCSTYGSSVVSTVVYTMQ